MAEGKPFLQTGELFEISDAFAYSSNIESLFNRAMAEALLWHQEKCPGFSEFLKYKKFNYSAKNFDATKIPPIFVTVFKENRLTSIADDEIKIELTSSGTGGQKSAIVLDNRSYKRILKIVDNIFSSLGMMNRSEQVNYLCFTYDPKIAKNVGTAFSDKILTGLTLRKQVFYSIKWNKAVSAFEFDLDSTVNKLISFAECPEPVRILGFPAYLWQVCEALKQKKMKLNLGKRSFVITGGGWKIHKDQEVTKDLFKDRVCSTLGIPAENIRDSYGMVEHGIPYVDCEKGRLHVPIYAKARVVDPETLDELAEGETGLLHLMTPYLSSYPSISLLTTDKAQIHSGCPCKRPGSTIEILGRAGLSKHKGCAITALDLLKN